MARAAVWGRSMTVTTFANGTISQRVEMIENALEKVLDRQGMEIASGIEPGAGMDLMVVDGIYSDFAVRHSLYIIARELEALLP